MTTNGTEQPFSLGDWRVSPATCLLERGGKQVKITPRSMDVLVFLFQRSGSVISTSELLASLWKGVTSDHAVHKAIAELRQALGDDAHNPTYIKTIPRRGYLLVDVQPAPAGEAGATRSPAGHRQRSWAAVVLVAVAGVAVAALAAVLMTRSGGVRPAVASLDGLVSVGVLPFQGDGGQLNDNQFLIDGITASMLSGLSRLTQLRVVSAPHDRQYSTSVRSAQDIGAELAVGYLLEGQVMEANGQYRVSVSLVRTSDASHVYAEQFDLNQGQIFDVQDSIASAIVTALSIHLNDEQRSRMLDWGTNNALAYEQFMLGEFYNSQFNPADFELAIAHHQEAIALDPQFMNAYLGVATAANNLAVYSRMDTIEQLRGLVAEVHRAVASIDRGSPELESIRAIELRMSGVNHLEQEALLREDILSGAPPDFALAHYALFLIGARLFDEAEQFLTLAEEVDPFEISPDEIWSYRADIVTPQEEIAIRKRQLQERPNHVGILGTVARNLVLTGNLEEAMAYANKQKSVDTEGVTSHFTQVVIGALTGELYPGSDAVAREYAKGPDFRFSNGVLAFMLDDIDAGVDFWRALQPLQKRRLRNLVYAAEKFFAPGVIEDPRYQALLEEVDVGLSWQRRLMEGVLAMEPLTGVALSERARAAYDSGTLMTRNNRWPETVWESLERMKREARVLRRE